MQQIIIEKGEGPYALYFAVKNLNQAHLFLEQQGIKFTHKTGDVEKLVIDPSETSSVRINFVR